MSNDNFISTFAHNQSASFDVHMSFIPLHLPAGIIPYMFGITIALGMLLASNIALLRQHARLTTKEQFFSSVFREVWHKQTQLNVLYLLTSFPLGLAYVLFLVPGIVLGLGTIFLWIGAFILITLKDFWWRIALFERRLAMHWLQIMIDPLDTASPMALTRWQQLQIDFRDPLVWKTLLYALLKFPLGIVSCTIALSLIAVVLIVAGIGGLLGSLTAPIFIAILLVRSEQDPWFGVRSYLQFALSGFGLCLLAVRMLDYLAIVAGQFASIMLSASASIRSLKEAQRSVLRERTRAEVAEQRRRELVVNVSHELRTPVASIAGHLEALLTSTQEGTTSLPPATLYKYLRIAHQESRRLALLVDELLELARIDSGELRLNIQPIAVREAIEEVYHLLNPLAQRDRQVTLVRGVAPHLPLANADYQRLVQVLMNLTRNAITSTPAGGIVSISLERADEQYLLLVVADNGIGIAAADLAHIFERFYRADSSRARTTGGFGLGLAIVHDIVVAMGGSIEVESEEGKGSRFSVKLRIAHSA